jgi:hypothetical protein
MQRQQKDPKRRTSRSNLRTSVDEGTDVRLGLIHLLGPVRSNVGPGTEIRSNTEGLMLAKKKRKRRRRRGCEKLFRQELEMIMLSKKSCFWLSAGRSPRTGASWAVYCGPAAGWVGPAISAHTHTAAAAPY